MVESLKAHPVLGRLLCGVIPANEAVAYAHHAHKSVYEYNPDSPASQAYAMLAAQLIKKTLMIGGGV
ncbi:MAG: hypothetical protein K8L91_06595, partial [Anaerolineae bacterium]|nr:hypothetical protein [Anaerolineae bacterium]